MFLHASRLHYVRLFVAKQSFLDYVLIICPNRMWSIITIFFIRLNIYSECLLVKKINYTN